MDRTQEFLRRAGKGEYKVAAVFGVRAESCERVVRYLRRELPDIPVWLFSTDAPLAATAAECERVVVETDSLALLVEAEKQLWPCRVVLAAAAWTGERGHWPVKLAPLLVPPFRALLMNRAGDFFPARRDIIRLHLQRTLWDDAHSAWNRFRDLRRGVALWAFALAAQSLTWLWRPAFHRRTGTEALDPGPVTSAGNDVIVFRYRDRRWNRVELDRILRTSSARWILFLEDDAPERPLPWPDGETFAVSLQNGYRDYRPGLFPLAPFRPLQPEEVSQTLAPLSTTMLVDRARLAALGIPRTFVTGAAWRMLFWKAAAAGWRSYNVGGEEPVIEIADWPWEDAECALRVLRDPALRALGPRHPDLARGSIATIPGPRAAHGGPRVLVVSPYLPYPLSHGGAVRMYNLCRALAGRVNFTLACFREKNEFTDYAKLHEVFQEVHMVDRDEHAVHNGSLPRQVSEYGSRSMRALVAHLAPCNDLLQVEYTHLAAFRDAAPRLPAILVEHDVTFTLYRQYGKNAEYRRWLEFERHWLRAYDSVWTVSEQDRDAALAEGSRPERTFVIPNGVDLERFAACGGEPAPEVFYVGSFRHRPNVLAFEKLRHEIMPRVWANFPEARLRVVAGPDPGRYWHGAVDPRIVLHGFVADLRPLYRSAAVVVAPLAVSAGTNIKVLEAMACRKAVVSTTVGCAGLGLRDGRDAVIRDDWGEFAEAVTALLSDAGLRASIALRARATVEQRYGWDAIAREAWDAYRELLA